MGARNDLADTSREAYTFRALYLSCVLLISRVREYFLKLWLKLEATLRLHIHPNLLRKVKIANEILLINRAKSILC